MTAVAMPRLSAHVARRQSLARGARSAKAVRHRPDAVLWALALMNVTYVWRLQSLLPFLKPLRLGLVSGVLAFALFLLDRSPRRRLVDIPVGPLRIAAGLLAAMTLSIPAGIYPSHSAMHLAQTVIPTMLLMVMVAASARSLSDVEWIASINMKAAAGYCLFVLAVFRVDANGRLAELVFYDTNDLGLLIVSTLPFAAYFVTKGHRRGRRVFALLCIPLFLFLLVQTGSRGAFIGLSAVAVYLGLFYRGVSRVARVAGVTSVAAAFVIFGGAAYFDKIGTIFNPTQDYNWEGKSATGRMEIWKRGLGYLGDHPLTGVGIDNFQSAEGKLSAIGQEMASRGRPFKWSVAHNSYLETAAEAGPVALLCFVSLFIATLVMLRRVARAMARLPYLSRELVLAQVLMASIVGYLVCAFFISAEYFVYPYVLLGLSLALAKSTLTRPRVIR